MDKIELGSSGVRKKIDFFRLVSWFGSETVCSSSLQTTLLSIPFQPDYYYYYIGADARGKDVIREAHPSHSGANQKQHGTEHV